MKRFITALLCTISLLPAFSFATSVTEQDIFRILQKDTTKIFDVQRANLYMNNALIKDTLFLFLGISHDPKSIADGYVFMDGCRVQSCNEKAAVMVDMRAKHLQAASLLHFNCRLTAYTQDDLKAIAEGKRLSSKTDCDREATLEMFLIRRHTTSTKPVDENKLLEEMRQWGKAAGYARENVRILEVR